MWPKISWQTNLTFPGNNLSQTISRSTCHKQNTTSGQVVLQANHPKNPWDLNHPQVPVVPRSSRVDQHTRTFNKITKQHVYQVNWSPNLFTSWSIQRGKNQEMPSILNFLQWPASLKPLDSLYFWLFPCWRDQTTTPCPCYISPWRCRWPHFHPVWWFCDGIARGGSRSGPNSFHWYPKAFPNKTAVPRGLCKSWAVSQRASSSHSFKFLP